LLPNLQFDHVLLVDIALEVLEHLLVFLKLGLELAVLLLLLIDLQLLIVLAHHDEEALVKTEVFG
jgi:hypothetical protein